MLASRSRRPSFRRAVVQVVAAFAPLAGCEFVIDKDDPDVISNPPPCEVSKTPGCVPPAEECPEAPPVDGSECGAEELVCVFSDPSRPEARCEQGRWTVSYVSVNPPYYDECPSAPPEADTPCNVEPGVSCSFGVCELGIASCEAGSWQILHLPCPPPVCPAEPPQAGTACPTSLAESCGYGDCYGEPTELATCVEGVWQVQGAVCNPPPCPEEEPLPDSECFQLGEVCSYGDCYGVPTRHAECLDGHWTFSELTCNPPFAEE